MSFEQIAAAPDSAVRARVKTEFSRFVTALACLNPINKEGNVYYVNEFRKELQSDDEFRKKVFEYIRELSDLREVKEFDTFTQFLSGSDEFPVDCIKQSDGEESLQTFENAAEAARAEKRSMCAIS